MERPLTFFFHFNKQASKAAGKPQITIHYQKKCILVDNVSVNIPVSGYIRKTQPRFVMKGKVKPSNFKIENNVAYLN